MSQIDMTTQIPGMRYNISLKKNSVISLFETLESPISIHIHNKIKNIS